MPLNHSDLTLNEKQTTAVCDGGKIAVLTQDDIITLKLVEDFLRRDTLGNARTDESDRLVETLERILKQVG
jgi:hypothetical protein